MLLRPTLLPAFGAAIAAMVLIVAMSLVGPQALVLPIVLTAVLLLLARPVLAVAVAVGSYVLVEGQSDWGPSPQPSRIYEFLPGTKITGAEALLLLAVLAVLMLRLTDRRPILLPGPFTGPLVLVLLGIAVGALAGRDAGVGLTSIANAGRTVLPLVLVAFVVVQVVDDEERLRRAIGVTGALAAVKGFLGIAVLVTGQTSPSVGQALTYYQAPANMLMLGFFCVVPAAALTRTAIPAWVWVAWPVVASALLLSYRRSFWIAAALALTLVLLTAIGKLKRRFGIPALVISAATIVLAFAGSGGKGLDGSGASSGESSGFSVQSRIASLSPTRVASSREDRYRIGERRNVVADLRASPVAGLGLGVDYSQRYPLSIGGITHDYVHVAALWWWMKLGLLGLLAYAGFLGAGVWAGWRAWRSHADPLVRAFGLGAAAALVGYAAAETTGTFAGADARSSVVLGALFGLLSAAWTQAGPRPRQRGAPLVAPQPR